MSRQKVEIASYHGNRNAGSFSELILWILAAVFLAVAVVGLIFYTPVRVTGAVCLALALSCVVLNVLNRWAKVSPSGVLCRRILLVCFAAAVIVFAAVEGVIVAHARENVDAAKADAVIVLGAGVNGSRASVVLQSRIDAAKDYLTENPDAVVILSGGQGAGENISEAQCMCNALVKSGVDPSRLHLEESSTTTAENFTNSKAILSKLGIDPESAKIAVITSGFHCFRSSLLAKNTGLDAVTVPAQLPGKWRWLSANYYVREVFALGKLELTQLFA